MKIDRSKLKKSTSEVPSDCQALIERLTSTASNKKEFLKVLQSIESWTFGKCELLHWVDVLDGCDEVLEAATRPLPTKSSSDGDTTNSWALAVDSGDEMMKDLVVWTLNFTTFLIEHSFSRHLYSSMEHLTSLLASSDLDVVLAVLNLLYMFSKRSNFIMRLVPEKRAGLLGRLTHLAASWGGKDNGFGLYKCCSDDPISTFPDSATTLHFEYYAETTKPELATGKGNTSGRSHTQQQTVTVINVEHVDKLGESPSSIMEKLLRTYHVPEEKRMQLFTYLRLAASFSDYSKRLKCVQARLHALSILIYSHQLTENVQSLLYSGLLEELVEVLEMKGSHLMEIKAAALKSLTAIIHLDRNPNFPKLSTIIDVTGAASYHGFLPVLVRSCIASLTSTTTNASSDATAAAAVEPVVGTSTAAATKQQQQQQQLFPQPLATALFSFLYHLASYEAGGEALVSCGMMESLLKVIQWPSSELDHITFVTRAVRVIDLITNLDMQSFQTHSGISIFISRLELEVDHCRKQQPFQIQVGPPRRDSLADALEQRQAEEEALAASGGLAPDEDAMDVDQEVAHPVNPDPTFDETPVPFVAPDYSASKTGLTCLPQRAALLKSMLNFLKKAIQDPGFSDSIRHVMDGSLPNSLKHIISNAEYYGPSLFLLATDVVTAYVFQEPSLLSSLQDNGLTDVVLHALLVKDVPATREVLGSLPNVFSALCLNNRGLNAFVACKPFDRLFNVLLSPDYLPAMRRRRSSDPLGDTASNLGNAMDELMRHQPSLKESATGAIIKLLEELCALGRDPKYVCWKAQAKPEAAPQIEVQQSSNAEGGSSDEEEEDEEETNNGAQQTEPSSAAEPAEPSPPSSAASAEKESVPLVDYIHNVMKFVDAILSNNSTDDHCREFVQQRGLVPLMGILGLPNLPIDFPAHPACQAVAAVSKSILNLAHEPNVLKQGLLHLNDVLSALEPLHRPVDPPGGSVLLRELVSAPNIAEATANPQATPLLHHMSAAHAYIQMFVYVCRTGQSEIRSISVTHWGSELGLTVLKGLSRLYTSLVWESTVLLALCNDDTLPPGCEFGKADMDKLLPQTEAAGPSSSRSGLATTTENEETFSPGSGTSADSNASVTNAMETLSTEVGGNETPMEVDEAAPTAASATTASTSTKPKTNPSLHHQIKQIKPLLSSSSRLGRALAELFALLVKHCVGSPLRQRRGQQIPPSPVPPTQPARAVASALTKLLTSGLSWEPPPTSPIPRFRLTFIICSVGFTTPMLFDEKKYPYHLMLSNFMTTGGQRAFFETFDWVLSSAANASDSDNADLPGTGEFLDSWLMLLEKMVNPKMVLESPHVLPNKASGTFKPTFEPMKYLSRTHKLAFNAVMKLWSRKPMKTYGARTAEAVLTILCHILKGEKVIAEKQEKDRAKLEPALRPVTSSSSAGATGGHSILQFTFGANSATPALPSLALAEPPELDPGQEENVQQLMDMGFPRERCIEAILTYSTLDQATDYLLRTPSSHSLGGAFGYGGNSSQDDMARALAMSLGENVVVSTDPMESDRNKEDQDEEEQLSKEDYEPMATSVIDDFTHDALNGCLSLLDSLPDTVYRVCDLLLAIFNRNGNEFKEEVLRSLLQQVYLSVEKLGEKNTSDGDAASLCSSEEALKAAARIHLFTLLFEECKLMCARLIKEINVVALMNKFLSEACHTLLRQSQSAAGSAGSPSANTPKWMTPMLLLIDLHEKVVLGMNRRNAVFQVCEHKWKLFDISNGRWTAYHDPNNKQIDEAYWNGETSVRIQFNRKKYNIQFGTMMQVNEETGNRRPVMISIVKRVKPYNIDKDVMDTDEEKKVDDADGIGSSKPPAASATEKAGDEPALSDDAKASLLRSCVTLMQVPVDSDALNAVLRLSLRLTQDFHRAVDFCEMGGVKMILGLTQASSFSGFTSLATLLIRHVMEDPATLRYTMEKVVRSSAGNSSTTTKELHYLLRVLAPAACRTPDLFGEVARELLRVDTTLWKRGEPEDDPRLLVKSLPGKSSSTAPALAPPLPEVASSVIRDLLNFLVQVIPEATSPDTPEQEKKDALPATAAAPAHNVILQPTGQFEPQQPGQTPTAPSTATTAESDKASKAEGDILKKRPLMTKSAVCRLLAELVKSYGSSAKLITDHIYSAGLSEMIKEDTPALAFMLDELLIGSTSTSPATMAADKESSQHVKTLIAALSSCNHYPEAQTTLVSEVKSALSRALALPEGTLKHTKIQALTALICTMIESCPSSQSHQTGLPAYKQHQYNMNNMVKIMLKRGLVTDLARVSHSLDLSSPNVASTINAVLKPLETLSRIVNQPSPLPTTRTTKQSKAASDANGENAANASQAGGNGGGNGTNTTNSEATRAQGDETLEHDGEATEHDVSTAAESIDPNSESQLQTVEEGNDDEEEFEEMMDQLLERDNGGSVAHVIVAEVLDASVDETHHDSQMMSQDQSHFEAQQSQDEDDEDISHSEGATEENDDDDDDGGMEEDDVEEEEEEEEDEDAEDADEDEEDDEDDDDDDDDEGGSPYNDEFAELEEATYRIPLGVDADDDELARFHYNNGFLSQIDARAQAIHLPLWNDADGSEFRLALPPEVSSLVTASGISVAGAGGVAGGANASHVTPSHPMLMGRQVTGAAGADAPPGTRVLGRSLQRQRHHAHHAFREYLHLGTRGGAGGHASGPAFLQNLLGTNPQELIRRGGPMLVDVGYAILDSYENDVADLDNLTGGTGRAALSSIPSALVRWTEESRVIDGDSLHDCVTALKPDILKVVEDALEEEMAERRAKRKKAEEEEAAAKAADAAKADQARKAAVEIAQEINQVMSEENNLLHDSLVGDEVLGVPPVSVTETVTTSPSSNEAFVQTETLAATAHGTTSITTEATSTAATADQPLQPEATSTPVIGVIPQSESYLVMPADGGPEVFLYGTAGQIPRILHDRTESTDTAMAVEGQDSALPDALGPLSPSPEDRLPSAADGTTTPQPEEVTTSATVAPTPTEEQVPHHDDADEPVAGPSGTAPPPTSSSANDDFSAILGIDVSELPEGVDPSFLAALPEDMRQEVIEEQRRLQTIRQRAAQNTEAGITEVNPEFLAALPPNIQEEVLAQQRIEQQRQAAAANPDAPLDAAEFLSTLPASLRQSVLADLEDSQLPSLPADLVAEAQNLRREYEQRNRAVLHERFFSHSNAAITSILRNTVGRMGGQYVIGGLHGVSRDALRGHPLLGPGGVAASHSRNAAFLASATASAMRCKGRQLLDQEGISCLLILLFIDDPKINTSRLHRILRNLCYHGPTREWVIRSLLSILEKSNEGKSGDPHLEALPEPQPPMTSTPHTSGKKKSAAMAAKELALSGSKSEKAAAGNSPSWLNISLDAALGFRANVFQVTRACGGKKSSQWSNVSSDAKSASSISIHSGASAVVCRHTLEVLISLAKSFPIYFLPWKETNTNGSALAITDQSESATPKPKSASSQYGKSGSKENDFWDILLRLDQQNLSRKGKSVSRSHSSVSNFSRSDGDGDDGQGQSFESSPFGQLLCMLSSPVIRRSSVLTDKLLRLLSYISLGQPDINKKPAEASTADASTSAPKTAVVGSDQIQLAVQVLTSKSCSEEGLEDVTSLLLNLSYGPEPTRETILKLLLRGAQELGSVVRQNILDLQKELQALKALTPGAAAQAPAPPSSSTGDGDESSDTSDLRHTKGALLDRFTREAVVITAPSKVKSGAELQLPSMNALTNKTSSQAFFLRVLKVIIQLREAALMAIKKAKLARAVKEANAAEVERQAAASAGAQQQQPAPTATEGETEAPAATVTTPSSEAPAAPAATPMEVEEPSVATAGSPTTSTPPDSLESLSEELDLSHLWDALSSCLRDLAHTPDHHAVLVLQATVEAFFLVHAAPTQPDDKKKIQTKETRVEQLAHIQEQPLAPLSDASEEEKAAAAQPAQPVVELPRDTQKFLSFAETHRTVLNQILRQSTTHLADGPFSVLVDHTRVLDFDIKRRYFRTELERTDEGMRREDLAVHVRRDNVFEDSFRELHRRSPEEWKNRFYIVFEGEEGQDAGGLLREWYVIISKEIFNPMYALFRTSPGDKVTYMIYESSDTNPNHLDYFKFVGRVIAKAIYDNKHLECYFTRSFYKHILAKHVKYTDMESEDYTFYKGLEFLIENSVEELGYELTFSTEIREFGVTEVRDLIPDGRNIRVTETNKMDYVRLVCQMKMTGAIRKQLAAFLEGFYSIIPRRLISIFNEQELELLLSGLPTIDIEDLKANTEYHKYQVNSLQVVWFWRALRSFDQTDKAKFLQFVTGSSKVPLQGFAALEGMNGAQKFQIHRDDRSTDRLPSAHTCFNQLDLPAYETFDKLKVYLLKAIRECSEGFGFA